MDEKIRIMAFLELIFALPKNDRNVSFSAISKVTGLNVDQVEYLVMRCMSLELIKGTIDEVNWIHLLIELIKNSLRVLWELVGLCQEFLIIQELTLWEENSPVGTRPLENLSKLLKLKMDLYNSLLYKIFSNNKILTLAAMKFHFLLLRISSDIIKF